MSFTTSKEKSNSQKNVLVKISLSTDWGKWVNYSPGVWYWQFDTLLKQDTAHSYQSGNYLYGAYQGAFTGVSGEKIYLVDVNSVKAAGNLFAETDSIAEVQAADETYYYDRDTTRLYIQCANGYTPHLYSIQVGVLVGIGSHALYYDDQYYEPRLKKAPVIQKSKDPMYYGIIRNDTVNMEFQNLDGFFDSYSDFRIFGHPTETLVGFDAETDYQTMNKGIVRKASLDTERFVIEAVNKIGALTRKLPPNVFTTTDYPDLNPDNEGAPIPLGYGTIYNAPATCTNEDEAVPASYEFKLCDVADHAEGIFAIDEVRVNDVAKATATEDLTNAEFTLALANYSPGDTVTVDYRGYVKAGGALISNPLDVIVDLLAVYDDTEYNATNYDTGEWTLARNNPIANAIGLYLNDKQSIRDIIEDICASIILGNFIVKNDGRYTYRIYDDDANPLDVIEMSEALTHHALDTEGTEFLASCRVGYRQDWYNSSHRWHKNDTYEDDVYAEYSSRPDRDFPTLLVNEADAIALAEAVMLVYKDMHSLLPIVTKTQNIGLEIMDVVNIVADRVSKDWLGEVTVEVVRLTQDLNTNRISIFGRKMDYRRRHRYIDDMTEYIDSYTDYIDDL